MSTNDKLTAIKIKQNNVYSDPIPLAPLAENVEYNDTYNLKEVLGTIDVANKGDIQHQLDTLDSNKIDGTQLNNYVASQLNQDVSNWLNTNVDPVGSAVIVDSSLSISGAAADAKKTGDEITDLKSAFSSILSRTRNMFDPKYLLEASDWEENNGIYSGTGIALNAKYSINSSAYPIQDSFEANQQYTISLKAKTSGSAGTSGTGIRVYFKYTDNSNGALEIPNNTSVFTNFKLTSASGKTVSSVHFTYGTNGNNIWEFKDIQLEKGLYQTEFINYNVPNDKFAREEISSLKNSVMSIYANAVFKSVVSNDVIHINDGSTIEFLPLVSVRRQNLLDPICKEYLYFSGNAGSYVIENNAGKRANVVDVSNISNLVISGDLSGFSGSTFRYAFTATYPAAGVSTISSGAVTTGTQIIVPNNAKYLIWTTGTTSKQEIDSNAMLNAGNTALTYSAYIADITAVSVTIDKDGLGTEAQTYYSDANGDVVGFVVCSEFYAYSTDAITIFITYVEDTDTAIREHASGGYISLQGDGDTFSMSVGTDQNGALSNARNIAIGNGNMESATAQKCTTVGIENMGNVSGEQNTSMGYHSLYRITTGRFNVAFGNEVLDDNVSGDSNSAFGAYALQRNAKGVSNTGVGYQALRGGFNSFDQNAKYDYNTAIGSAALSAITSAYSNVAIGSDAGKTVTSGSSNTFLGTGADATGATIHDSIALGKGVKTTANNQMMLGSSSITEVIMCGNKRILFNVDGSVTWETVT